MSVIDKPHATEHPLSIVADAACTACGCLCDDVDLTVRDGRITQAARACELGKAWFLNQAPDGRPDCLIDGAPAALDQGIDRAAQILAAARYPLVYGLARATCEAQRVAVAIGDWIGGIVDTSTSADHGPTGVAFQGVGEVTCSLGEVANRSDLVIFWGTDPAVSHPRHFERYSLMPQGMFVPRGRQDRTCVVVDVRPTASAREADVFLQVAPGKDFEALWILRALAQGLEIDAATAAETGVPPAAWQDLMNRMKQARFGVLFYGSGLSNSRGKYLNSEALLTLVRDMNAFTRFAARPMRAAGNTAGADNVLAWRTGYPFGVNLSRGYPRFNPGEYTAAEVLARGEADAALVVAADGLAELDEAAQQHLARIPCVVLDAEQTAVARAAAVAFTTATYGIHTPGTVYRMDDVPIPLRPALRSPHSSDEEILSRIEQRIRELKHAARA